MRKPSAPRRPWGDVENKDNLKAKDEKKAATAMIIADTPSTTTPPSMAPSLAQDRSPGASPLSSPLSVLPSPSPKQSRKKTQLQVLLPQALKLKSTVFSLKNACSALLKQIE